MNFKLPSLKHLLKENQLDALLISSPAMIIYLTGYAGFSPYEREAFLFITKTAQFVITDGRYSEAVMQNIPEFELLERTNQFTDVFKALIKRMHLVHVGFEEDNLTVAEYTHFRKLFKLTAVSLEDFRITKTEQELAHILRACALGDEAFTHIQSRIAAGITERELADELEWFIRRNNGTLSFPTIVAFGPHSAIPHHHTDNTTLKRNDVILIDFGVKYEQYCSDMTRTLGIGEIPDGFPHIYNTVKQAQEKAVSYVQETLKKGESPLASKTDSAARSHINKKGLPPFSHALGHGIGIEVHESPTISPRSRQELTEGMVFSIEPGIYLPRKFGVRIEDLFTIKDGSLLQLTHSSHDLIVL